MSNLKPVAHLRTLYAVVHALPQFDKLLARMRFNNALNDSVNYSWRSWSMYFSCSILILGKHVFLSSIDSKYGRIWYNPEEYSVTSYFLVMCTILFIYFIPFTSVVKILSNFKALFPYKVNPWKSTSVLFSCFSVITVGYSNESVLSFTKKFEAGRIDISNQITF